MAIAATSKNYEEEGNEEWKQVRYRKEKRSGFNQSGHSAVQGKDGGSRKIPNPNTSILNRMAMTLYITNFPHRVSSRDIYKRCLDYGVVTDVFISNRLSKAGKRFGFVRYIKVGNAEKLLSDLRSIWFGNHRLFADVEKFGRTFKQEGNGRKRDESVEVNKEVPIATVRLTTNKSYAEVLSCDSRKSSSIPEKRRIVKIPVYASGSQELVSRTVFVKLKDPESIPNSRKWILDEGFVDFEISYIGGRWIQIVFANVETKASFLSNESLKRRYITYKSPCDTFVPDERMVWVEVSGVPKGVWHIENFQSILGSWAKSVFLVSDWDSATLKGKVCVLSRSSKFIFEELVIDFKDKLYDIWIRECATWEPKIARNTYDDDSFEGSESGGYSEGSLESDEYVDHSASFDSNLCKEYSVGQKEGEGLEGPPLEETEVKSNLDERNHDCNTNLDGINGGPTSLGFVPIKENIEVIDNATENDIFSLDQIIEKEAATFKRAKC